MAEILELRWPEVERLLDQALELPVTQRAAFLDQTTSGDGELKRAVELLLLADQGEAGFLDEPARTYAAPLLEWLVTASEPGIGTRLGSYEVVRRLGRGGMATVYLARDLKHDRDVALKVLHSELAAALGAERFLQEIRVTAKLEHPHILTLIDSGESDGFLWYVLPSIHGTSLRERIDQEVQLGVDEVLAITRQIASALDYAHHHGVIHRDIKPENILLHEGEAMLADFGIALAVQDAGGDRLTEADRLLGTPRYMSPEQATVDSQLDARSDVYSLGAVVYEMLAGEPPHTGATSQAVIAKVLAEQPTRLRTVREDVSPYIDAAIARALAKAPADRFNSAGDFVEALTVPPDELVRRRRRRRAATIVTGTAVLAVTAWLLTRGFDAARQRGGVVVRARSQLTFSGNAFAPAISPDGVQLAYVVKSCAITCSSAIEIQDLGGGASRRIVEGATTLYRISWSPDRRFLVFHGTIAGRFGAYIVPTLGGTPRLVVAGPSGAATFLPGGNSLLVTPPLGGDSIAWLRVTTLDGVLRDSIPVERPGLGLLMASMVTGGRWIVVGARPQGRLEWRILDRRGHQRDVFKPGAGGGGWLACRVTRDALWLLLSTRAGAPRTLVRIRIDTRTGRFTDHPDTVTVTSQAPFDVTADGRSIVYAEGTYRYEIWALRLLDALRGRFDPSRRQLSSTAASFGTLSPDGRRVLLYDPRDRISVAPYGGGATVHHAPAGTLVDRCLGWMPSGTSLWYAERLAGRMRFVTVDAGTGTRQTVFPIADPTASSCAQVAGVAWVWIPNPSGLRVQGIGERQARDLPKPIEDAWVWWVAGAPDRPQVLTQGWNATGDSILIHVISLADGRTTRQAEFFGEWAVSSWLGDGTIMVAVWDGATTTLYRVRGQGRVDRIGVISRSRAVLTSPSLDGSRLSVTTQEFRGDIWLAKLEPTR